MAYDYYDYAYIYKYPTTAQFYAGGNAGPNNAAVEQAKLEYSAFTNFAAIYGRTPTIDEFRTAAPVFTQTGVTSGIAYLQGRKAEDVAAAATAKDVAATSSFLSSFSPYASLADKGLTSSEAANLVSVQQNLKAQESVVQANSQAGKKTPFFDFMPAPEYIFKKAKANPLPFLVAGLALVYFFNRGRLRL